MDFEPALRRMGDLDISCAESGGEALKMVLEKPVDLVVADEFLSDMTGLAFAKKLVSLNPMIYCACVSRLPSEVFHEKSEGLGLLMQMPPSPGSKHANNMMDSLNKVLSLTAKKIG